MSAHAHFARQQQALNGIKMLEEETAMHYLDPPQLNRVEDLGQAFRLRGGRAYFLLHHMADVRVRQNRHWNF